MTDFPNYIFNKALELQKGSCRSRLNVELMLKNGPSRNINQAEILPRADSWS